MSSVNKENVQNFIDEILARLNQKKESKGKLKEIFKEDDREPPNEFINSSYLYSRSYEFDEGVRPFSGITFWNSPDVNVTPVGNVFNETTRLNIGETYRLNCTVRNKGDLNVPSAKVEFYLVTPSIGFSTKFAKNNRRCSRLGKSL